MNHPEMKSLRGRWLQFLRPGDELVQREASPALPDCRLQHDGYCSSRRAAGAAILDLDIVPDDRAASLRQ